MSMVATLEFSSKEESFKVCNSATGQIIFEDVNGEDNELASVLISDNKNLVKSDNGSAISESTAPQNRVKLISDNSYLLPESESGTVIFGKSFDVIGTESVLKYNFISWTRGRGS